MANHRVHGQHHRHHAHHKHHAHRHGQAHGNSHQKQKTHTEAQKPTQAPAQAQKPQAAQGGQGAQPAVAAPAIRDDFKTAVQAPVTLAPGASGERKAPGSVTAGASAGQDAGAVKSGGGMPVAQTGGATPAIPAIPAAKLGTAGPALPATPAAPAAQPGGPAPVETAKPAITEATNLKWISQLAPAGADSTYTNGEANCGPAVAASIARAVGYGEGKSDAALIQELAAVGGTTAEGTSGNGIIAMYDHMGLECAATGGADMTWINSQLTAGHYITALGDYYQVPGRTDPALSAGHYLNVSGYHEPTKGQEAWYKVTDPMDEALNKLTAVQLQAFINAAPVGGFAIATWDAAAKATATGTATAAATAVVG